MRPSVNMPEEDRATDISNMHKNSKDRACGFGDILADRQTDIPIANFATDPAGEVISRKIITKSQHCSHGAGSIIHILKKHTADIAPNFGVLECTQKTVNINAK